MVAEAETPRRLLLCPRPFFNFVGLFAFVLRRFSLFAALVLFLSFVVAFGTASRVLLGTFRSVPNATGHGGRHTIWTTLYEVFHLLTAITGAT